MTGFNLNDLGDAYFEEKMREHEKYEAKRRADFFTALGIEDDGRFSPVMTREEYAAFRKNRKEIEGSAPKGARTVEVYFEFLAYEDVSYHYCFNNGSIYVTTTYIGD